MQKIVKKTVASEISDAENTGVHLAEKILKDGGSEILESFTDSSK